MAPLPSSVDLFLMTFRAVGAKRMVQLVARWYFYPSSALNLFKLASGPARTTRGRTGGGLPFIPQRFPPRRQLPPSSHSFCDLGGRTLLGGGAAPFIAPVSIPFCSWATTTPSSASRFTTCHRPCKPDAAKDPDV